MSATASLERAVGVGQQVLAGIAKEDMDQPTPCASWNVGQLVNHLIGANYFFVAMLSGNEPGSDEAPDFAAGDYRAAFDEATAASLAAFNAPGVFEQTIELPWGPTPGAAFFGLATTDIFQHSWDLAKASGQNTDLDPTLAAELLEGCRASIADAFRGPDGGPNQDQGPPFGPAQDSPDGACVADQLAAFLGRTV